MALKAQHGYCAPHKNWSERSDLQGNGGQMQTSWIGWVAFLVLAALISMTSCQAITGGDAAAMTTQKVSD